jgi:hypothetical protein
MAQRVQVLLLCDLHDGEVEGTETVQFAVDGRSYEIDVCDQHAAEIRDAFASYIGAGRRAGTGAGSGGGRGRGKRGSGSNGAGVDPAAVRAWARSQGIKVSERGRISADVVEQYRAAGF